MLCVQCFVVQAITCRASLEAHAMSGITRLVPAIARLASGALGVRLSTEPADKLGKDRVRHCYFRVRTSTACKSRRYREHLSWQHSRIDTLPASV